MEPMSNWVLERDALESLYGHYNDRRYVYPDPLDLVLRYEDHADREIAALIASSLAYGRVAQIHRSVNWVLDAMGGSPSGFVSSSSAKSLERIFRGFKHRFTTDADLCAMLLGIKKAIDEFGSIEGCFRQSTDEASNNMQDVMSRFVCRIRGSQSVPSSLLPDVAKGSACKRLCLFLKWMVRRDNVDPGGWTCVDPSELIVPLDIHMHRIGLAFGMTRRKQADMIAAVEVTDAFKKIDPADPTKYDFALSRIGMEFGINAADHIRGQLRQEVKSGV
jgi:uncharacterized protein (TIGR02757 family)